MNAFTVLWDTSKTYEKWENVSIVYKMDYFCFGQFKIEAFL